MSKGPGKVQRDILAVLALYGPSTSNDFVRSHREITHEAVADIKSEPGCNQIMAWHCNRSAVTRALRGLVERGMIVRLPGRTEDGYRYALATASA